MSLRGLVAHTNPVAVIAAMEGAIAVALGAAAGWIAAGVFVAGTFVFSVVIEVTLAIVRNRRAWRQWQAWLAYLDEIGWS